MAVTGPKTGFRTNLISDPGGLMSWGDNTYGQLGLGSTASKATPQKISNINNYTSIAAGAYHIAAIKTDGTLWTWGGNFVGELGNGSRTNVSSPIQIGLLTNWKQVGADVDITAAIKTDGTLWTWGYNNFGQIGNGTVNVYYSSPIQIGSLTNWSQIDIGYHAAAVKTDGTLWTWGYNNYGQLGNGTTLNYSSPIQVGTSTNWSQVSISIYNTAAVKTDGTLWSWGYNGLGNLGNGTTIHYSSPIQVGSLTTWKQVNIVGYFTTAAIKTDGTLWTWGSNSKGQLGNGTTVNYSSPIQIGSLTNWSQIGGSYLATSAIKTDGTLWACGYNNYGQLGNGTTINYSSPIQVGSLNTWNLISSGVGISAFVGVASPQKTDLYGGMWTIGNNSYGQLGNGTTVNRTMFDRIMTDPIKSVASAKEDSFFIKSDGTLWSMGRNYFGQSGRGNVTSVSSPMQTGTLTNWSQVACHEDFSFIAIKTDGTLWACGYGGSGRLGNGTTVNYSSPIQVGLLTDWKEVRCGNSFALALKNNGTIWTWGSASAALGLDASSSSSYSSPVQIGSLSTWSKIAAAQLKGAAIKTDGTLWMWGVNVYGALGNGTTTNYSSPIQVGLLTNWATVACGYNHTLAVKTDGTLWAWGLNSGLGQLGNGTLVDYSSPIQIGSLTNWKQVYTGRSSTSFATKTDGTLWAWGGNGYGQLGMYFGIHYSSPIQVGSLTTWSSVASENQITLAISDPQYSQDLGDRYVSKDYLLDVYPQIASATGARTSPGLWTWGSNSNGELGNNDPNSINYSSPIQVGTRTNWKQISCASTIQNSYAVKTDGTLWTWGNNNKGQLGNGTTIKYSSPIQLGSLTNWKQISGGYQCFISIKTDGTLWACGYNGYSTLGNGTVVNYSSPIQIGALTNWKQISIGHDTQSCAGAVKTDGTLWTWGYNANGQLGNNSAAPSYSSPIQIGALTNWKQVSCGYRTSAAIKTDGTLWTWGQNNLGQLGNGTIIDYSSPIQVGLLTNWKQVATGKNTLAIKTDGTLWACGYNTTGTLGNERTNHYSSPIQIGSLTNWKSIDNGGSYHAFGIKTDGTLWVWGYAQFGIGNGTTIRYSSPVQVGSLNTWRQASAAFYHSGAIADGYY